MRCTLHDILKVSRVLDDDSVFVPVNGKKCDDGGAAAYRILGNPGIYALMPNAGSVFMYFPYDKNIYQVHVAVLPSHRGRLAVQSMQDSMQWIFSNTTCTKILGFMPESNKKGCVFCEKSGGIREGVLSKADGNGGNMIIFGKCKCA